MGRYGVMTLLKALARSLNVNHGCTDHDMERDRDPEGHGGGSSGVQPGSSGEQTSPYQRWGKNTFQENDTCYTCRKKWKEDNLGTYRLVSFTSVAGKMMKYAFFEALSGQNE